MLHQPRYFTACKRTTLVLAFLFLCGTNIFATGESVLAAGDSSKPVLTVDTAGVALASASVSEKGAGRTDRGGPATATVAGEGRANVGRDPLSCGRI